MSFKNPKYLLFITYPLCVQVLNLPAAAARQANIAAAAAPGGPVAPAAPANQAAPAAAQRAAQAQAHQLHHAACKSYVCGVIIDIEVSMSIGVKYVCV